jgi:hypothetical protein
MIKRGISMLVSAYLFIVLMPYIVCVFFYAMLKYMAKEGSRLNVHIEKLESDLIQIILDTIKQADYTFLIYNLFGFTWIMVILFLFKKYKIVIPRKKAAQLEGVE